MQLFFRNCTHILTRTQRKKFEDMFLIKIASKGTSLIQSTESNMYGDFLQTGWFLKTVAQK